MKTIAIGMVLVLTASSTEGLRHDDAQVISMCIQSEVGNGSIATLVAHPAGIAFIGLAGPQRRGFVSDAQILFELEEWEGMSTERFPEKIRERLANWSVPPIKLDGLDVQYSAPPREGRFIRALSFSLWPPAYSDNDTVAFVRMMFTPSAHGATLTCTLKRVGKQWVVDKRWVKYFV